MRARVCGYIKRTLPRHGHTWTSSVVATMDLTETRMVATLNNVAVKIFIATNSTQGLDTPLLTW